MFGGKELPKVIGNRAIQQSTYDFLFDFNKTLYIYLVSFSSYSGLFVKRSHFNLPHLHLSPALGMSHKFRQDLRHQNTKAPVLLR